MNNKEKANDLKKEKMQASLEKKKACFKKAKECVENLLENNISESSLLEKVQSLSQADYQDVVEERAILKICGYAVCSNVLKNIPTKQFQISTVSNKVYDITERKNFCSSRCYKASCYLKEQIPTSPVWLRDGEDLRGIHLLPSTHVKCQPGVEVALSLEKVTIDETKKESTVSMFACNALEELKGIGGEIFESLCIVEQTTAKQMSENKESPSNIPEEPKKIESNENLSSPPYQTPEPFREKSSQLCDTAQTPEPPNENSKSPPKNVCGNIAQSSKQPKENRNMSPKNMSGNATTSSIPSKPPQNVAPSIAEKRDLPEKRKIVTQNVQLGERPDRASSKSHNLRIDFVEKSVQEWFSPDSMNYLVGETRSPPPQPEVETPVTEEEIRVKAFYSAGLAKKQDVSDKTIPVVEKYEQRTARQKIVFEKLSKILPEIVIILGLNDVSSQLRCLIETFRLEAHNVMMRPSEWNLVALIILKLLSKMNAVLQTSLASKKSKSRLSMMLRSLQLEDTYLDTFVEHLFNNAAEMSAAQKQ